MQPMTHSSPRPMKLSLAALAALALLSTTGAARAQDADAGFDHRRVAYDPQRSVGYGGCAVAHGHPSSAVTAFVALAALAVVGGRRRRCP